MPVTAADKLARIERYVIDERSRIGIVSVDTSSKREPSGSVIDEFSSLLDIQLLTTAQGSGGWTALNVPEVLDGVYSEVLRRTLPD